MAMTTTRNLLVNGDAETGGAANDYTTNIGPIGWQVSDTLTTVAYKAGDDVMDALTTDISAKNKGGQAYFAGGYNDSNTQVRATQEVSLADYATTIGKGNATFTLAGDLGGYSTQDDSVNVTVTFYDKDGMSLTMFAIDGPTETDRGGVTELIHDSVSDAVPDTARYAIIEINCFRTDGLYNDGYADNLSFKVSGKGVTGGVVEVQSTHDYSAATLGPTNAITFGTTKNATNATFSSTQFGSGSISTSAAIYTDAHHDTITVNVGASHSFGGSALLFVDWTNDVDVFAINGSSSADTIVGTSAADTIDGGGGNDTIVGGLAGDYLTGGGGHDTFDYGAVADSTGPHFDTIDAFDANTGKIDVRDLNTHFKKVDTAVNGGTLSTTHFDQDLAKAIRGHELGAHDAVLFTPDKGNLKGHVFLLIDANGHAGYQAGEDLVIELTHPVNLNHFGASDIIG